MQTSVQLDADFTALADPARWTILARLAQGEDVSVMDLAEPFTISQPAISRHLKVLDNAGLISRGRDAQRRPCGLEPQPLLQTNEWQDRCRRRWKGNYRRLDTPLDQRKLQASSPPGKIASPSIRIRTAE